MERGSACGPEGRIGEVAGPRPLRTRVAGAALEGADRLVQAPLHALHRIVDRPRSRELLLGETLEHGRIHVAITGRAADALDDLRRHWSRAAMTMA